MRIRHLNTRAPRVEMLPLIDIVFLLLVLFIYTMLSISVHKGLPVSLPTGEQVQPEKETLISVTVFRAGEIFVGKTPVALEELKAFLKKHPDGKVWLCPKPTTTVYSSVICADPKTAKTTLHALLGVIRGASCGCV